MRLVLVDLDNTLVDRAAAFRAWAEGFARQRGLPAEAVSRLVEADRDGQVPREVVFDALRRELGVPDDADALRTEYRRDFVAQFVLATEVRQSLEALRAAGYGVVVVTNGPATQREKIAATGLAPLIDGCVVSEDVGVRKPDRRIFEAAAALAGGTLAPDHWMVGDHPIADVGGAAALGLRSIWIRRGRPWEQSDYAPTHAVDTFAEAARKILDSLA